MDDLVINDTQTSGPCLPDGNEFSAAWDLMVRSIETVASYPSDVNPTRVEGARRVLATFKDIVAAEKARDERTHEIVEMDEPKAGRQNTPRFARGSGDPFSDIDKVTRYVAKAMGVAYEAVASKHRTQRSAWCRQVAMYVCREVLKRQLPGGGIAPQSFPNIGLSFDRDHSSVIHAWQLVGLRVKTQPSFWSFMERLKAGAAAEVGIVEETIVC